MTTPDDGLNARIEQPSGEVERPGGAARMPGARREGYTKFPTGPVSVEPVVASGPDLDGLDDDAPAWEPLSAPIAVDGTRLAPWALFAAVVALVFSFFVGWGLPVAIIALIASIMSLRRPVESRAVARWALALSIIATVYSVGWLSWALLEFADAV